MIPVIWAVDSYIFEEHIPIETFDRLGIKCHVIDYRPFVEDLCIPFSESECVITYGTINAIRHLKSYFGTYLREYNLRFDKYYSNYNVKPTDFLNSDHFFATFYNLKHNKKRIYEWMNSDTIFIRPNSGSKSFTGKVITEANFYSEIDAMEAMYNLAPEELIVVSTSKKIKEESRFIICGNKAIANSRYQINGVHKTDTNTSTICSKFVDYVLQNQTWTPEEIFTLDVALTENDEPKVVELNSFSCAGWYDCDEEVIIRKVSEFTYNLWKEAQT